MRPGLHWTKAPEMHERLVKPHIHHALEIPNILEYIWGIAVSPGKRVNYLGEEFLITKMHDDKVDRAWMNICASLHGHRTPGLTSVQFSRRPIRFQYAHIL